MHRSLRKHTRVGRAARGLGCYHPMPVLVAIASARLPPVIAVKAERAFRNPKPHRSAPDTRNIVCHVGNWPAHRKIPQAFSDVREHFSNVSLGFEAHGGLARIFPRVIVEVHRRDDGRELIDDQLGMESSDGANLNSRILQPGDVGPIRATPVEYRNRYSSAPCSFDLLSQLVPEPDVRRHENHILSSTPSGAQNQRVDVPIECKGRPLQLSHRRNYPLRT